MVTRTTSVHSARTGLALAIGALVLAACIPVKPPPPPPPYQSSYCGTQTPVNAAGYQQLHDALRTVNADFAAADLGLPVDLGDGRGLWLYGDTFVGYVLSNDAIVQPHSFVHNSFILQNGACLTPLFGGPHGARSAFLPAAGGAWYWPMSAYVDGAKLFVFLQRVIAANNFGCGCHTVGIDIASFSLPGMQLLGVTSSPAPFNASSLPVFGDSVVTDSGYHFVDGHQDDRQYVARIAVGADPGVSSNWSYWNGGTTGTVADWTPTSTDACVPGVAGACPMTFDMPNSANGPLASISVIADPGGGFMASAKLRDIFSDPVYSWWSATPHGPWTLPRLAAPTPPPTNGVTYGGRIFLLHTSAGAVLTAEYSTNGPNIESHASIYKVVFASPANCSIAPAPRPSC